MVLLALAAPARAAADPPTADELQERIDGEMQDIIDGLDMDGLQSLMDGLENVPEELTGVRRLIERISTGRFHYLGADILDILASGVREPLRNGALLFSELLLLLVVSGVLAQMTKSFAAEGAARVANLVVYAAAAIIVVHALSSAIRTTSGAADALLGVSQGVYPVLSMMLASTGGLASNAVLQPAYTVVIETSSWMTKELLIPAAMYGGVLAVAGNLTEKNLLSELGGAIRSASVWVAGAVMTVFVAISAIQGSAAVSYDGISFRTAKYAVDSMIPYLGGMFSDMADTFVGCSMLVRNAVGMVGLLMLVITMVEPVLTALCVHFAFRLAAALASSFESKQLSAVMGESAKVVMLLLVILLMSFLMLFFLITITINAGNAILAMR